MRIHIVHFREYLYIHEYFVACFPCKFVSVNRQNNEARAPYCNVAGPADIAYWHATPRMKSMRPAIAERLDNPGLDLSSCPSTYGIIYKRCLGCLLYVGRMCRCSKESSPTCFQVSSCHNQTMASSLMLLRLALLNVIFSPYLGSLRKSFRSFITLPELRLFHPSLTAPINLIIICKHIETSLLRLTKHDSKVYVCFELTITFTL